MAGKVGACRGTTPVCGADEACHACTMDADCASQTCLPDGSCASPLDVLYVSPTGSNIATCTPDDHCSLGRAFTLIEGSRSTIRLDPAHYDLMSTVTLPVDLELVGRGVVLDRNAGGAGEVLTIAPGTHVVLDYLAVIGGDGSAGHGIVCNQAALTLREVTLQGNGGSAISSTGCQLVISHSQLIDNQDAGITASAGDVVVTRSVVSGNQTAGLDLIGATFDVENDLIAKNGGPGSALGGVFIAAIHAGAPGRYAFAFNTVAENQGPFGVVSGVVCDPEVEVSIAMTSSIVVDNSGPTQVSGATCFWMYSDIAPGTVFGTGNRSSDPLFVDPAHNNFHLQSASPARDAADPAATLAVDIDGEPRPQGAGRDMGAYEIQ
jgi:hypothetical protein